MAYASLFVKLAHFTPSTSCMFLKVSSLEFLSEELDGVQGLPVPPIYCITAIKPLHVHSTSEHFSARCNNNNNNNNGLANRPPCRQELNYEDAAQRGRTVSILKAQSSHTNTGYRHIHKC